MTTIKIFKQTGKIVGFECYGHTGFDESGKDILCSAVSTLCQVTALALEKVAGVEVKQETNDGYLKVTTCSTNEKCETIYDTFVCGACELQKNYKKYINIKYVKLEERL